LATVKLCIPTADGRITDHCRDSLHTLQNAVVAEHGEIVLAVDIFQSCYLYSARNFLIGGTWEVDQAIANASLYDYYWFIDSDIGGFDLAMLKTMIHAGNCVSMVPYVSRTTSGEYVCGLFNFTGTDQPMAWCLHSDTVRVYGQCDWSGMGCCLFHKSVFTRRLPFPWFRPEIVNHLVNNKLWAEVVGEDIAISRSLHFRGMPFFSFPEFALVHKK